MFHDGDAKAVFKAVGLFLGYTVEEFSAFFVLFREVKVFLPGRQAVHGDVVDGAFDGVRYDFCALVHGLLADVVCITAQLFQVAEILGRAFCSDSSHIPSPSISIRSARCPGQPHTAPSLETR